MVFAVRRVRRGWVEWARRDLNPGLPGYEPYAGLAGPQGALTGLSYGPLVTVFVVI